MSDPLQDLVRDVLGKSKRRDDTVKESYSGKRRKRSTLERNQTALNAQIVDKKPKVKDMNSTRIHKKCISKSKACKTSVPVKKQWQEFNPEFTPRVQKRSYLSETPTSPVFNNRPQINSEIEEFTQQNSLADVFEFLLSLITLLCYTALTAMVAMASLNFFSVFEEEPIVESLENLDATLPIVVPESISESISESSISEVSEVIAKQETSAQEWITQENAVAGVAVVAAILLLYWIWMMKSRITAYIKRKWGQSRWAKYIVAQYNKRVK